MHLLLASFNACDLVSLVSRFSCEVFGVLIAVIYLGKLLFNRRNFAF